MTGEVIDIRSARARVAAQGDQHGAWTAFVEARVRAEGLGPLRAWADAVRLFEVWLALAIPDPRERAEVWP